MGMCRSNMPRRYSSADIAAMRANGLSAELPAPKPRRKNEEMKMQMAVIAWWRQFCLTVNVPEFLLWHTPNGSVYSGSAENRARVGAMMKRQGCRGGVPDLFLAYPKTRFVRTPAAFDVHGLFIELKTPKGILSLDQNVMLAALEKQGYQTAVCRTVEDAQRVITSYLT